MKLFKKTKLVWSFYKSYLFASIIITVSCLILFHEYGFGIFTTLFWFKIATLAVTFRYINSYKSKEYYYYQNLGLSRMLLWTTTLILDVIVFIILIILTYMFK